MEKKDKDTAATTADEAEEGGGGGTEVPWGVGPPAVGGDEGAGAQSAGEVGDGAVGGAVVVGGGGGGAGVFAEGGEAPGAAETVIDSFWPAWQWRPMVQM